ncbi:hypothetical protein PoB_007620300 [Plakobranchus ocellatus]|uniref:Uncharacterized protein n=1 Tax=Plakobranchus ocellatus TaxID=259542 RepID=A0AAV4DZK0_9GAST|nr:hypothetical protein PoB_007620300 [Plakobranchus ocellatus]
MNVHAALSIFCSVLKGERYRSSHRAEGSGRRPASCEPVPGASGHTSVLIKTSQLTAYLMVRLLSTVNSLQLDHAEHSQSR